MNIIDRARNIITSPATEWPHIASEPPDIGRLMVSYVLPLAAIPAVAQVIGIGIVGGGVPSMSWSLSGALATGIVSFLAAVAGVYVTAYVIDFLAPTFSSNRNLGRAVQLVAYSFTPGWIAGVLHIIPALDWLVGLASLYGLYLAYLGMPHVMGTPNGKIVPYLVVAILVVVVVSVILHVVLTRIVFSLV
jgi:hypothetical protein